MKKVDYDERLHAVYPEGRSMSAAATKAWLDGMSLFLPSSRPLRVADIGSGTGRFTPHLAERFGSAIGVEPFERMRARAEAEATHPRVEYVAGSAERLPMGSGTCDAALLFFVWHHVEDRTAAAREVRRVVRDGGTLLIRTQLSDDMPDLWFYELSNAARLADQRMYQPLDELRDEIERHGWRYIGRRQVHYEVAPSRVAYADRLRLRAISTFEHMESADVESFFASLDAAELDSTAPVFETGDLLAWRAT